MFVWLSENSKEFAVASGREFNLGLHIVQECTNE